MEVGQDPNWGCSANGKIDIKEELNIFNLGQKFKECQQNY
jgi:hypothetical protein